MINKVLTKITILRKQKNLTTANMAADLNISISAYRKIEQQVSKLTIVRLVKILEVLEIDWNDFFEIETKEINQELISLYEENSSISKAYIESLQAENRFLKRLLFSKENVLLNSN